MRNRLRKRCERCGIEATVPARQRKCHERKFGRGSYCCWGRLTVVVAAKKEKRMKANATTENAKRRPQDVSQKKLEHARKMVSEKTRAMARLAQQLRTWERKANYYAKRASMTDAELLAEKAARVEAISKRRPKRRAIKIGIAAGGA
jgi:hypothetical protein